MTVTLPEWLDRHEEYVLAVNDFEFEHSFLDELFEDGDLIMDFDDFDDEEEDIFEDDIEDIDEDDEEFFDEDDEDDFEDEDEDY